MSAASILRAQWQKPSDIFSILMILGGDLVQKTIAQLSAPGVILAPTPFSFGWIGYAFTAASNAMGNGQVLPAPDWPVQVINSKTGYLRTNQSWIIGRLLRDREMVEQQIDDPSSFVVEIFEQKPVVTGWRALDWVWWSGVITIIVQLGIAAVPWAVQSPGDWSIFFSTAVATVLAVGTASVPNWQEQKWKGRKKRSKTICLTRGNGARYAMVINPDPNTGLDLEDLSSCVSPGPKKTGQIFNSLALAAWLVFLLTACGQTENPWYLLGVGTLGMIQNLVTANVRRDSIALGIPLERIGVITSNKTMKVLQKLESDYETVGRSLLQVFFPGKLRPEEEE